MSEILRPALEKSKKIVSVGTVSAIAFLGLSGCASESESVTWRLQATCPNDVQSPEIRNIRTGGVIASFDVSCEGEAPSSIELVSGPEAQISEEAQYNIEVVMNDESGGFLGPQKGSLNNINVDNEAGIATVNFQNVDDVVRVAVIESDQQV